MGTSIIDFWKREAKKIGDFNQVGDTSAIIDTTQLWSIPDGYDSLGDDWNRNKQLKAEFVLCASELNLSTNPAIEGTIKNFLVPSFQNMINGIFNQVLKINVAFTFSYCKAGLLPEELNFNSLEEFETKRNAIRNYNAQAVTDKKRTNKDNHLDRGIRVIEILPDTQNLNLHSNAEKNGIVAHIYLNHLIEGQFQNANGGLKQQWVTKLFDITPIHEICHIFGLSDRYQFLLKYSLSSSGDCLEGLTRDLVPYPVSPELDEDGLDYIKVLNNLMYGADNYCRGLTDYQRQVLLGYLPPEPDYQKSSILVEAGRVFKTGAGKASKRVSLDGGTKKEELIIFGIEQSDGSLYTYTASSGTLQKDYTLEAFTLDGKSIATDFNEWIGYAQVDNYGIPSGFTNNLYDELSALPNCDGTPIKSIIANSTGN